ncbi:MAG: methylmalonyl-CoA epimerase [Chloroflexi bacterium]|nr:methylmalonyl-CoA epimerase [Chloroflexota bacterium]
MALKIDHVGIAVVNADETTRLYTDLIGIKPEDVEKEVVESQKIKVAMLPVGESKIELLEGLDPEGVVAKFIAKKGEGIHHLAIGVKDIKAELENLKKKGVPLVDTEPRIGAGGHKVAFLHPKATKILLELVEVEH